jgi:threonine 3-dehydrogenase
MKALVKTREEEGFDLQDIPVPEPKDDEVLVKLASVAICGSDLKLYKWTPWCRNVVKSLPFIPGHEGAGEVVKAGGAVTDMSEGDMVAAETHIACGTCWQCRHGRPHTCLNMGLFGHTVNGCFAEYCVIPRVAARKLPPGFPLEKGCLLEPMGIPFRAVEAGDVEGDSVVVIGCGPIGQFAMGTARVMGAKTIVGVDPRHWRREIAGMMGATHTIDPEKEKVTDAVLHLTDGIGAGVVIEASGSGEALAEALAYVRVGGRLFTIGHPAAPVEIDVSPQIVLREIHLAGFFGREIWDTWEKTEMLVASGELDPSTVVTHTLPLDEYDEAFRAGIAGEGCKIVLVP